VLTWKAPLVIYAAVALTTSVAWIIFGRNRKRVWQVSESRGPMAQEKKADLSIRQLLRKRSTILLALATMGCWCLGNAMGSWLPSYYHEVFNMPLAKASSILALITVGGTAACIVGGILPLRVGRRRPFLIISGIFMGLSALGAILFNNLWVIYVCVTLFGIFGNLHSPTLFTIPLELPNISPRTGSIIIFMMLVGGNFGNFIGPLFVGYLTDITGSYLPGFIICAVISFSLLLAGLLLPETGPLAKKTAEPALAR
jgi:MFS family permease